MNKQTILKLVEDYRYDALNQIALATKTQAYALIEKDTLEDLKKAVDTVQNLCAVARTQTGRDDKKARMFNLFGYASDTPSDIIIDQAVRAVANDIASYDDDIRKRVRKINDDFMALMKAVKSARGVPAIKLILEKAGLPEIVVDSDGGALIDYVAIKEVITALKALPAPVSEEEGE